MQENLGDDPGALGEFRVPGQEACGWQGHARLSGRERQPADPEDPRPAPKDKPKLPDRPVRIIYVDATTGLPMRSIFARANKLDKPIFEANYSYPVDLKIEAPKPKAASQ